MDVRELIHDAAIDRAQWVPALNAMAGAVGARVGALLMHDQATGTGTGMASGLDPARWGDYFEWNANNPLLDRGRAWRGDFATDRDLIDKRALTGSDFFNGFLRPNDMNAMLGVTLGREDGMFCSINLMRPLRAPDYEAAEAALARDWLPDLRRAFQISLRFAESEAMLAGAWGALDAQPRGVVLLDGQGRIMHANAAAEALFARRDGVRAKLRRLVAASLADAPALEAALARAAAAEAGSLRLRRAAGRPLAVHVLPVVSGSAWLMARRPGVVVFLCDPDRAPPPAPARLRALFGFTPAESALVAGLADGSALKEAADALGIGLETARTHLKRAMAKAGVDRQTALVVRLLREGLL